MEEQFWQQFHDQDGDETAEWRQALAEVMAQDGHERVESLLWAVWHEAQRQGVPLPVLAHTPYVNSIPTSLQPVYPGDLAIERRLECAMRWNAVMMVLRANKKQPGVGGHLSTYASAATLYEVGFHHIFQGADEHRPGDFVYYQGHVTPGLYARAYLEGRLSPQQLDHFRQELQPGGGLSSYPHPWLMPEFWQFPTVSMGLGPLAAIYQARFARYCWQRGLLSQPPGRTFAFLGDGECDEPESLGALSVATREDLSQLTFVINCNLQRLDGPVRGNGKIVQELEGAFRGAGWHVVKVLWNEHWDPLLASPAGHALRARLGSIVDGALQKAQFADGAQLKTLLFAGEARLEALLEGLDDLALRRLQRGGHDPVKVYAAYQAALASEKPTCLLMQTIKGHLLGGSFEGSNVTHQMKKLDEQQLKVFRDNLQLPIADSKLSELPYYHPGEQHEDIAYLLERRRALGGPMPRRISRKLNIKPASSKTFAEFLQGSKGKQEISTTMAFVRLLRNLLRDEAIGPYVIPIVPDEARTFGMDAFFREFGIYAPHGQLYTPVDANLLLHYHEAKDGRLLEEGITEAGSMASFTAAGTAHAMYGLPTIPFYIFYSMFGLQRTGDQVWAAADGRTRGFLLGATAGRTTLHGEGLQHDDGHSHLLAMAYPNVVAYDPGFAYETAVIVQEGLRRMLQQQEDVLYYLTLYNENYAMPPMPEGAEEGILQGMYLLQSSASKGMVGACNLLASGPMLPVAQKAAAVLQEEYRIGISLYSVTSYQQLYRQARAAARLDRLHMRKQATPSYLAATLAKTPGPIVSVGDWVEELPRLVASFVPHPWYALGTNGLSRSDGREALRAHFEVDLAHMVTTVLYGMWREGSIPDKILKDGYKRFGIDRNKPDPFTV